MAKKLKNQQKLPEKPAEKWPEGKHPGGRPRANPNKLNERDMSVFEKLVITGKSIRTTAKDLGISTRTVMNVKQKPAFRQLAIEAIEEIHNFGIEDLTDGMIANTKAEKAISVGGNIVKIPDYKARILAYRELAKIYGVYAPTEQKIEHSFTGTSDAELLEEIESACERHRVDSAVIEPEVAGGDNPQEQTGLLQVPAVLQQDKS